ncbi:discoidin domain-containing protein [Ruminiclostridium herbifermentans]|uniref:cellulase n=1 Tax=Ruminiclostridium herbifermentans TaxID=2488810 RepID=A0A4U7JJ43_9FIRM|nr:discoidin domain-containing protein [Ruminiclostridium herbifermentans]QNU66064.1 discoidin domain-containing protein [Ruminiclostridium herbifermentans]
MKKLYFLLSALVLFFILTPLSNHASAETDSIYPGFRVKGRFLYDKAGEKVILYGINKMIIWMDKDGVPSFSEIAKTGANSVRIVWTTEGTAEELDTVIRNCRAEHMIPMVELHDATGEWHKLQYLVDYWVRPDILEVIKKHQEYLLINIGNEVGNDVSAATFTADYSKHVKTMRAAGIHVPLIIDASRYGQDIDILQSCGPDIIAADPDKNVMFSVHMWWPYMYGYTDQRVRDEIAQSVQMELPLIVGEFGHIWDETESGKIPYKVIIEECYKNEIGYLPWSWGPGNNPQTFLDMTTDGTFATLQGWGLEVCMTSPYSINKIAKRPASMLANLPPVLPEEPLPAGNLALNKPVKASSVESALYSGSNITDGDKGTRWASSVSDNNWVYVDLGKKTEINKLIIVWEAAYATQYKIQVSDDETTWTDLFTQYNGTGKTETISLNGSGRYLRIYCSQRYKYDWPFSIFEIGVYGPESELSASISPTVAVYDKNPANQAAPSIIINPKANTLIKITTGDYTLVPNIDYTLTDNTLTFTNKYMSSLPIGTAKFTLDFDGGVDPVFAVAIGDTTPVGSSNYSCGDYNKDGAVDALDFAHLKKLLMQGDPIDPADMYIYDLNLDNSIDALDFATLKMYLLGTITKLPYSSN